MPDRPLYIAVNDFEAQLPLERLHELPRAKYRKLLKIALSDRPRNQYELDRLRAWLADQIEADRTSWQAASQDFVNGWKFVKNRRSRKSEVREILRENDRLKLCVKRSKAMLDARTALLKIYTEIIEEEK